jgi:hypothetical protein
LATSVEGFTNEIKAVSAASQSEKQNNLSEFQKVNLAVSYTEAKFTAGPATQIQSAFCTTPHHNSPVRAEDIGQGHNNTTASPHSHSDNTSSAANVTALSTCNVSACNGSLNNVTNRSCNSSVNALSVAVPNDCADLNELSLPNFRNSSKQVVVLLRYVQ